MKFKKEFFVGLILLTIITTGVVCATDTSDNLKFEETHASVDLGFEQDDVISYDENYEGSQGSVDLGFEQDDVISYDENYEGSQGSVDLGFEQDDVISYDENYEGSQGSVDLGFEQDDVISYDGKFEEDNDFYFLGISSTVFKNNYLYDDIDYFIEYDFSDDVSGEVTVKIDKNIIYHEELTNNTGYVYNYKLNDFDYGIHDLEFIYTSNDGIHNSFKKTTELELTYTFWATYGEEIWLDPDDAQFYWEDGFIVFSTPVDSGTISYTINGKCYTVEYDELEYDEVTERVGMTIPVDLLKCGENNFVFNYIHPDFPVKSDNINVNLHPRIHSSEFEIYFDESYEISLNLPSDANGNLEVYGIWNGESSYDYRLIKSQPLKNGFASVFIDSSDIGEYDIHANYSGCDYEVLDLYDHVYFCPKIDYPERVWINGEYNMYFEFPNTYNGLLTLTIGDESKTTRIIDGKGNIKLFNFGAAEYDMMMGTELYVFLSYVDDNDFNYTNRFILGVSDTNPNFEFRVNFDDELVRADEYSSDLMLSVDFYNLPKWVDGQISVIIDGKSLYTRQVDEYVDHFDEINITDLSLGKHDIEFKFFNDSYYSPISIFKTLNIVDIKIEIPNEVIINGDTTDELSIALNQYVSGNITIWIDGKQVKNIFISKLDYRSEYCYCLGDLDLKTHNIEVKYSGDNNHAPITKSCEIKLGYNMIIDSNYFSYGDKNEIIIHTPENMADSITVDIGGKLYDVVRDNNDSSIWKVDISNLDIGEYEVKISYPGDKKYPNLAISQTVIVQPEIKIIVPEVYGDQCHVYLKLPKNAKGNLNVVVCGYIYDMADDYRYESVTFKNGMARIDIPDLILEEYYLEASYDGEDYEVPYRDIQFTVSPKIISSRLDEDGLYESIFLINETEVTYSVEMPSDIPGNFIVKIDGEMYAKNPFVNGHSEVTINNLKLGDHMIEFSCDSLRYYFESSISIHVYPLDMNIPIYPNDNITMVLPSDAKGNLIFSYDGKEYSAKFNKGVAIIELPNLPLGWIYGDLIYDGDDYGPFTEEFEMSIKPYVKVGHDNNSYCNPLLTPISDPSPHNNINISLTDNLILELPTKFNGKFIVEMNDDFYKEGYFVDGVATISLANAPLGLTKIFVDYEFEKDNHQFLMFFANIKKASEISVTANDVYDGQKVKITVNAAKEISDNVVVTVNNKNYTVKMSKGKGSLEVANLAVGSYPISVKYLGDKNFAGDSAKSSVNVLSKLNPNMIVSAHDIMKGDLEIIKISADKSISGSVLVNINNNNYTVELTEGQGSLNVSGLNPDTYTVQATFKGNDMFISQSVKATFKVTHIPKITAKAVSVLYTAKGKYSVTVYGTDGKVANGVNVVFKIAGKKVKTVKTNSKGVATFTVTKAPGTYKVSATALGKTVTKKLTVKHVVTLKKVTPKKAAKKLVLTATLKKVNGKYLKNKQITFKFNGKKYVGKTNKKGVAKVTIKKSVLKKLKVGKKVTYQATYLKDIVKQSVKVKK